MEDLNIILEIVHDVLLEHASRMIVTPSEIMDEIYERVNALQLDT